MTDHNDRSSRGDHHEIDIPDFRREPDHFHLREREVARGRMALWMVLLVGTPTLLLIGGVIAHRLSVAEAKDLWGTLVQPIVGILIGVVAFFFGERRNR